MNFLSMKKNKSCITETGFVASFRISSAARIPLFRRIAPFSLHFILLQEWYSFGDNGGVVKRGQRSGQGSTGRSLTRVSIIGGGQGALGRFFAQYDMRAAGKLY